MSSPIEIELLEKIIKNPFGKYNGNEARYVLEVLNSENSKNDEAQPVKPVTYSVIKAGLIGLTRYLATYWADRGVRSNALSPGGVFTGQDDEFVQRLTSLIPVGRMARRDEYHAAIQFLCSDASAYLNGQNIVMDGGRSVW